MENQNLFGWTGPQVPYPPFINLSRTALPGYVLLTVRSIAQDVDGVPMPGDTAALAEAVGELAPLLTHPLVGGDHTSVNTNAGHAQLSRSVDGKSATLELTAGGEAADITVPWDVVESIARLLPGWAPPAPPHPEAPGGFDGGHETPPDDGAGGDTQEGGGGDTQEGGGGDTQEGGGGDTQEGGAP